MEIKRFFKRHKVLIECVTLSFLAHALFFSAVNIVEVHPRPLPPNLRLTLLSMPSLWEKGGPFAEGTSEADKADMTFAVLAETRGSGSGPKLELFHKQLLWDEEPRDISPSTLRPGLVAWAFRKGEADYSAVLRGVSDNPSFLASRVAERVASFAASLASSAQGVKDVELSDSLEKRGVVRRELPVTPEASAAPRISRSTRLSVAVDAEGTVRYALIERSSGDADADAAALTAVCKWRFSPTEESDDGSLSWGWVELSLLGPSPKGAVVVAPNPGEEKKAD